MDISEIFKFIITPVLAFIAALIGLKNLNAWRKEHLFKTFAWKIDELQTSVSELIHEHDILIRKMENLTRNNKRWNNTEKQAEIRKAIQTHYEKSKAINHKVTTFCLEHRHKKKTKRLESYAELIHAQILSLNIAEYTNMNQFKSAIPPSIDATRSRVFKIKCHPLILLKKELGKMVN